jgi:hypothetical protein
VFSDKPMPIVGLALWDVSPEMLGYEARAFGSALALVDALWPGDRIRFGTFSGQEFAVSPLLTGDKTVLRRVVDEELWFSTAGTPLWNALARALGILAGDDGRRVLMVMSSRSRLHDEGSPRDVRIALHRADALLYAVGLEGVGLGPDVRDVARETGGGYLEIPQRADLAAVFRGIASEIHQQYLLGFVPEDDEEPALRPLSVEVKAPGATVRARRSYASGRERD